MNEGIVCTYNNGIIVLQQNITSQFAIEDVVIDINFGYNPSATTHLDVSQSSYLRNTACKI